MKKDYEKPKIIIEFFPGQDIITFSGGDNPEYPEDPIIVTSTGADDY